jgi:hypothetical protein
VENSKIYEHDPVLLSSLESQTHDAPQRQKRFLELSFEYLLVQPTSDILASIPSGISYRKPHGLFFGLPCGSYITFYLPLADAPFIPVHRTGFSGAILINLDKEGYPAKGELPFFYPYKLEDWGGDGDAMYADIKARYEEYHEIAQGCRKALLIRYRTQKGNLT